MDGAIWVCIDFQHRKPGKGNTIMNIKMKNVTDGRVLEIWQTIPSCFGTKMFVRVSVPASYLVEYSLVGLVSNAIEPFTVLVTVPWLAWLSTMFFTIRENAVASVSVSVFSSLFTIAVTLDSIAVTVWSFSASSLMVYFRVNTLLPSFSSCGLTGIGHA